MTSAMILAAIRGGFEKFVDFFLTDQRDRVFFVAEKGQR